jgi:hypothetical protein
VLIFYEPQCKQVFEIAAAKSRLIHSPSRYRAQQDQSSTAPATVKKLAAQAAVMPITASAIARLVNCRWQIGQLTAGLLPPVFCASREALP